MPQQGQLTVQEIVDEARKRRLLEDPEALLAEAERRGLLIPQEDLNAQQLIELMNRPAWNDPETRPLLESKLTDRERRGVQLLQGRLKSDIEAGPVTPETFTEIKGSPEVDPFSLTDVARAAATGAGHFAKSVGQMYASAIRGPENPMYGGLGPFGGAAELGVKLGMEQLPAIQAQIEKAKEQPQSYLPLLPGQPSTAQARIAGSFLGLAPTMERTEELASEGELDQAIGEMIGGFGAPMAAGAVLGRGMGRTRTPKSEYPNVDAVLQREPARTIVGETSRDVPAVTSASLGEPILENQGLRSADIVNQMSAGQRRQSGAVQKFESFTERMASAGGHPNVFRQQTQRELFRIADETGRRISGYEGQPEALGAYARQEINAAMAESAEVTGARLKEIARFVEGSDEPTMGPLRSVESVTPESIMGLEQARGAVNALREGSPPVPGESYSLVTRARKALGIEDQLGQTESIARSQFLNYRAVEGIYNAVTKVKEQLAPAFSMKNMGTMVDFKPVSDFAARMLKDLDATLTKQGGPLSRATVIGDRALLEAMATADRLQKFSTVQRSRTTLMDITRRNGDMIGTPSVGTVRQIVGLTSKVMEDAVRRASRPGGRDLVPEWKAANAEWAELRYVQDKAILGEIAKSQTPERFSAMLESAGTEQLQTAKNYLRRESPEAWNVLKAQHTIRGLAESQKGELNVRSTIRAGLEEAGVPRTGKSKTQRISPATQEAWMEAQAKNGTLKIWYEPDEVAALLELIELERRGLPLGVESGPGITQAAPGLAAGGTDLGLMYMWLTNPAAAAAGTAGLRLIARVLFRPKSRNLFMSYARAVAAGNMKAASVFGQQLSQHMRREYPEVLNDAMQEQQQ